MTPIELNKINRKFWKHQATIEKDIWKRGFVYDPALEDFRKRLAAAPSDNASARLNYFRSMPSFNAILQEHDRKLAPYRKKLAQQERACQPRRQVRFARKGVNKLIEELANGPGLAKQLWEPFVKGLDALGYRPKCKNKRSISESCQYVLDHKPKTIGERQFVNRISAIRSKRKKSLG